MGRMTWGRAISTTRLALIVVAGFTASQAAAQTAPLPGPAQPGLLERRFEQPELPKAGGGEIITPDKEGAVAPAGAEETSFVLKGVVIEGATAFQQADFLPLYETLLDTTVSVKTVYDIAQAITTKYTVAGYVLSQAVVPPQKINGNGFARIKVIEGFVDKVIIQGDIKGPRSLLESYGDKIRASRPLKLDVLERYLLLASDLPGATADGTLKPSDTVPGAADLVFEVSHKSLDAFTSFDNRGSKYVGPWQLAAGANLNSVLGLYERTSLQMVTTPFNMGQLKYGKVAHEETIDDEGTKLSADMGYADSHPGWTLRPNALRSHSLTVGFGVSHPFIRSRAENLTLRSRIEVKGSDTTQTNDQLVSKDQLRIFRGGGSYDWVDTALSTPAVSLLAVELSQGIDAFGARTTGSPNLSRSTGHSDFFKATLDATRTQSLFPGISLMVGATAQWAASSLLSSEEFSFGGAQFGRGYDPAELSGDHGLAGKLELQYAGPEVPVIKNWQLYGFYDIGRVWQANPMSSERRTDGGASTGFGVRANLNDSVSVTAELAKPLTHSVVTRNTEPHDVRGFFGLVARY